jgi:hypothetical protein
VGRIDDLPDLQVQLLGQFLHEFGMGVRYVDVFARIPAVVVQFGQTQFAARVDPPDQSVTRCSERVSAKASTTAAGAVRGALAGGVRPMPSIFEKLI